MKFIAHTTLLRRIRRYLCAFVLALAASLFAQPFSTTTVQGTVYLANGHPGAGTLQLTWPAFTTARGEAVAAGRLTVEIGSNGFMSVNLAPNQGASPAGLYYTAIYHLSDGTTSTEYWTVPVVEQATIAQVRAQVMPAAQAVQAVSKTYVDQSIQQLTQNLLTSSGGNLIGPLYLKEDPQSSSEAATKHYVDTLFSGALPVAGGIASGPITGVQIGAIFQVDQQTGSNFGAKLQACIRSLAGTSGGTCDARNFSGIQSITSDLTLSTANITIHLPCATISTSSAIVITPGTRNVTMHGCALRGTSASSGSQGGTVFLYSGVGTLFQVGDSTYATDTLGFHLDNVVVNTATAESQFAQPFAAWRTQELNLQNLYLLGNFKQTAMTLDGTGNYTGGTFENLQITGFNTAISAIGHQSPNSAPTDWLNASTFVRLHINCPVSNGNPFDGTTGIDLAQGDGNTFTGGDVEGCATALHLGPNAQNNTIVGLRTENSTNQVIADAGSAYNNWITGGTLFTGKLTDNGTRNSFTDTFHRSFNGLRGDWFGTQQDTTLTNHFRLGIGTGNERGLLNRYQTDYGYRWTMGLSDATGGAQFYQILDELNNVYRVSLGQYNDGQASTNNQTVVNSAGTGAIVLNGSNRAGTGGVVFGSGGANSTTVATINNAGNAQFNGTLLVGGTSQSTGTMTVRNNADAEVDYYLWPGLTTNQKGSFTYKDYAGNSQWYMVKDTSNNWALNSAIGGLDSIKAYQSSNSGDTYINASNSTGAVRINYETGAGSAFHIYGGSSGSLYASFLGANAIKFPGLAAGSGRNCLQIDNAGYLSNTGAPCGTGGGSGTVSSGKAGQIAYYNAAGASIAGLNTVPLSAGGTGAGDASTALANLGALPTSGGSMTGPLTGTSSTFSEGIAAGAVTPTRMSDSGITYPDGTVQSSSALSDIVVDKYLSAADGYGGQDYCYAVNRALATVPPRGRATLRASSGPKKTWSVCSFNKSVEMYWNGAELNPQCGGGNGAWCSSPVTIAGATVDPASQQITVASTSGLSAGMRVAGMGIPAGAYISCVGTWSGSSCVPSSTQFTISLMPRLDFTGTVIAGGTSVRGVPMMNGLTSGMTVSASCTAGNAATGLTISSLHYGGSSPSDTQGFTLSSPASATCSPAYFTVGSAWTTTLTAQAVSPAVIWVNDGSGVRDVEYKQVGAAEHDLTIVDSGYRAMTGLQGEQIIGFDGFKSFGMRIRNVAGAARILGGNSPSSVALSSQTVREGSFFDAQMMDDGDLATGQAVSEVMTGASGCPGACYNTDEINTLGFHGDLIAWPHGVGHLVGTYNSAHWGTDNGPRYLTWNGNSQVEGGFHSGSAGGGAFVFAPADLILVYQGQSLSFEGSPLLSPGYGHFVVRDFNAPNLNFVNVALGATAASIPFTVSSQGGSSTIGFVSDLSGESSFPANAFFDGQGAILTDHGSCSAGCNVYLATSDAVSSDGSRITLAAPLYGSTSDANASLLIAPGAMFGYFAAAGIANAYPNIHHPTYYAPNAQAMGLYNLTDNGQLWMGLSVNGLVHRTSQGVVQQFTYPFDALSPANYFNSLLASNGAANGTDYYSFIQTNVNAGTNQKVHGFSVRCTWNESAATGNSNACLYANATETNLGNNAGSQYLLQLQLAGIDKWGVDHNGLTEQVVGNSIASSSTIAPIAPITHVTGTAAINTITVPSSISGWTGCLHLIPDGAWTLSTSDNIAASSTAIIGRVLDVCYDNGSSKWYPSY